MLWTVLPSIAARLCQCHELCDHSVVLQSLKSLKKGKYSVWKIVTTYITLCQQVSFPVSYLPWKETFLAMKICNLSFIYILKAPECEIYQSVMLRGEVRQAFSFINSYTTSFWLMPSMVTPMPIMVLLGNDRPWKGPWKTASNIWKIPYNGTKISNKQQKILGLYSLISTLWLP